MRFSLFLALQNMYKLLKPSQIGTNYMVKRLEDNIAHIGHEKVQSLKGENVCALRMGVHDADSILFSSCQHYSLKHYLNCIENT